MGSPSISVVIPVRDAASTIASVIVVADRVLRAATDDYEILVVDAGSADHTAAVVADLVPRYPGLRWESPGEKAGYGAALGYGLAHATKELVIHTSGDACYDARDIVRLLEQVEPDVDAVIGWRAGQSPSLAERTRQRVVRRLFDLQTREVDCEFRLIRRRLVAVTRTDEDGELAGLELNTRLHQAGCRFAETPVGYRARRTADDGVRALPRLARRARGVARLWWRLQWRGDYRQALAAQTARSQASAETARILTPGRPGPVRGGAVGAAPGRGRGSGARAASVVAAPEQ
jgi:glycosyltransferase involved in cell wall biosynthesis